MANQETYSENYPIEVDPDLLGEGSDYQSAGYDTSTTSLNSMVTTYIYENGRRYQCYFGTDKTVIPNDGDEQSRLDLHHEIFLTMMDGKLHLAPIPEDPHHILDIGTGTGIWAIDMADQYPSAEVLGTDLSPIQPSLVPPNCKFEVDDAEEAWVFPDNHFDFIHIRNLAQSIIDWERLMKDVYRCLKPGGWVELGELGGDAYCDDGTMAGDNGVKVFSEKISEAMMALKRPWPQADTLANRLKESCFIDVTSETFKQPSGPWPKDKKLKQVGLLTLAGSDTGYHAYGMAAMTRILGMSKDEAEECCRKALASAKNSKNHTYTLFFVAYGRKQLDDRKGTHC